MNFLKHMTNSKILDFTKKYTMIIALVLVTIFFTVNTDGTMLLPSNVNNVIAQNAYVFVLATGMLLCILTGGNIDLSVGSVVCFVGAIGAVFMVNNGMNPVLAVILMFIIGTAIGAWQAFWIAYVRIPPFIVTLSGMLIFRGLSLAVLKNGKTISIANCKAFVKVFGGGAECYVPDFLGKMFKVGEDFEDVDKLGDWMLIDADGDDNYWNYSDQFASHSGIGVLFSQSYDNNTGALTPDNWVITPGIELASSDNYVSFWVTGQDPEWNSEHYGVYVCTSLPETLSDLNNFELLFEGTNPVDGAYEEEEATVVTSQGTNTVVWQHIVAPVPDTYNGKTVYVAFRHFNCTDMFYLNLDDVSVTKGMPEKTVTSAPALASVKPSRTVSPDSARK